MFSCSRVVYSSTRPSREWLNSRGWRKPWLRTRVQSHSVDPEPRPYTSVLGNDYVAEEDTITLANAIYRPWAFNLPTLDEMLYDDWVDKVADWPMFWVMLEQWMYVKRGLSRRRPKVFIKDYLIWLGLNFYDAEELPELLEQAIAAVKQRMPELKDRLVPMPLVIPAEDPGNTDFSPLHVTDTWMRYSREWEVRATPVPAWEEWDEWDLRAWMEKRRQKAAWHADFLRRQDLVGKYPSLNITDANDSRLAALADTPYRTYSVEEVMDLITQGGRTVDPNRIPVRPEDPLAPADWFSEGVHYVPDTEDVIRRMGHWAESEEELLRMGEDMPVLDEDEEEDGVPGPKEPKAGGTDASFPGDFDDVDSPMPAGFDEADE
eukprot:jgi/Botrbrau1/18457/Bobra.0072s0040.1